MHNHKRCPICLPTKLGVLNNLTGEESRLKPEHLNLTGININIYTHTIKMSLAQLQYKGYQAGRTIRRGGRRWEELSIKLSWLKAPYEPIHNTLQLI